MDLHFQKLKASLPVEVTAAFFAVKQIVDGARVDEAGQRIAVGENFGIMAIVLVFLALLNGYILYKTNNTVFMLIFSTILFFVWAINIDILRWEDSINEVFSLSPSGAGARVIAGVVAVMLSVAATVFALPSHQSDGVRVDGKNVGGAEADDHDDAD